MGKTHYKGELAKRLSPLPKLAESAGALTQVFHEKAVIEANERGLDQEFEKLPLLFDHYGIEERGHAGCILLVIALARDWVPGFKRMNDTDGPKRKWSDIDRARLSIAIDDHIDNRRCNSAKGERPTKLEAAEAIFKAQNWSGKSASPAALLKQAEKANPIYVAIERDCVIRRAQRAQELTMNG